MSQSGLNIFAASPLELLQTRRSGSAKTMKGPGPTPDQIRTMLACATRVPDHGKLSPWRFIVFEGNARAKFGDRLVAALKSTQPDLTDERITQERGRLQRAPVVIAVVSRTRSGIQIPEWEQILSAGASCQTLCIAAHSLGFVANWITEWYTYHPDIAEDLSLQTGERIAGFVYIGHPAEHLVDRPRPTLGDLVSFYPSS